MAAAQELLCVKTSGLKLKAYTLLPIQLPQLSCWPTNFKLYVHHRSRIPLPPQRPTDLTLAEANASMFMPIEMFGHQVEDLVKLFVILDNG